MKQIIFDTETTGMNRSPEGVAKGHYIVELAAIKLEDRRPTGEELHLYFKPKIKMSEEVIKIHNITNEFLADKPSFAEKSKEIEAFFADADEIIAHNLSFDQDFVNTEFKRAKRKFRIEAPRFILSDTLVIARQNLKDISRHNLDALCNYYRIDKTQREKQGHGALLDTYLLLQVWLRLTGGQEKLLLEPEPQESQTSRDLETPAEYKTPLNLQTQRQEYQWLAITNTAEEIAAHEEILAKISQS